MHHCKLARVIQLEAGYPPPVGKNHGFSELAQLAAVDQCFHHILLDVVVVVDDLRHQVAELRKVLEALIHAAVVGVVGGRLGSSVIGRHGHTAGQSRAHSDYGSPDWAGRDLRSLTAISPCIL